MDLETFILEYFCFFLMLHFIPFFFCVIMHLATHNMMYVQFNNKINADQQKERTIRLPSLTIMYEIELCLIAVECMAQIASVVLAPGHLKLVVGLVIQISAVGVLRNMIFRKKSCNKQLQWGSHSKVDDYSSLLLK